MPREAGAKDRDITVLLRKDIKIDGRPALNVRHHPELEDLQPEALSIGQQLGRGSQRVRRDRPVDDA